MIAALAFVPPHDVTNYFEPLSGHIRNEYGDDCDEVLEYMEDNYIGRLRVNAPRRAPTFLNQIWNVFHRTFDELPRTNNSIEGWHRNFQTTVGVNHPSLWRFLDVLKQEEALNRVTILQTLGGHLCLKDCYPVKSFFLFKGELQMQNRFFFYLIT